MVQGRKECPVCDAKCPPLRQYPRIKFIDREIQNLKVKCKNHQITQKKAKYLAEKKQSQHNMDQDTEFKSILSTNSRKRRLNDDNHNHNNKRQKLNDQELCKWVGCYSNLEEHQKKCPLEVIQCKSCTKLILRRDYKNHKENICPKMKIKCIQCMIEIKRDLMDEHIERNCRYTEINCKSCGQSIRRYLEARHIEYFCPETFIDCKYKKHGCQEKRKRKYMTRHLEESMVYHLGLVQEGYHELENNVNALKDRVEKLEAKINGSYKGEEEEDENEDNDIDLDHDDIALNLNQRSV